MSGQAERGEIRVILAGVGRVGRDVARLLMARPDYQLAAAYSRNPTLVGQDLGLLAAGRPLGVIIQGDRQAALKLPADTLIVATTSFLKDVAQDLRAAVESGLDVITTAEEAAYPWITDARLSDELDALAKQHKVSILGVGLNPGFIFDALLLTASGIAWDVQSIHLKRVVDVSRFSATIQRRLGVGFSQNEFEQGVKAGTISGHIGFPQTFTLVSESMGRRLERIEKWFEPLLANRAVLNEHFRVETGQTAGFVQHVVGTVDGAPWIKADFTAHIDPVSIELRAEDSISIEGHNSLHLSINPGCNPQRGSAAIIANCIPRVMEARPGFLTVADLSLPHARMTQEKLLQLGVGP